MKLKKTLAGLLAFSMLFSATACSSSDVETRLEEDNETDEETQDRSDKSTDEEDDESKSGLFGLFGLLGAEDTESSSDSSGGSAASSAAEPETSTSYSEPDTSSGYSEPDTSSSYSEPEPSTSYNDSGDTLSILTWGWNTDTQKMVTLFLDSKGYDSSKVNIVSVSDFGDKARDNYKMYLRGNDDADLLICDYDWLADFIYNYDLTMPLSGIGLNANDFPNAYGYTLANGTNEYGELMAVTNQITTGGFVYRADLAKEYLGVTSPEEMQRLIGDWDSFRRTGDLLYGASGGRVSLQATESGMWQAYQCSRTQPWVVNGRLIMDNAEDYMDLVKYMKDNHSLAGVPMWDPAWYSSVIDGSALGDFVPTWGLTTSGGGSILENFTDGGKNNNMAFCEGPCGWFWGGSYIAVANKCDNATLAREFIEFYCNDYDSMKDYCLTNVEYVNNRQVMGDVYITNPLLNGQDESIIICNNADRTYPTGSSHFDSYVRSKFNDFVIGYLDGDYATKADAIEAFKREISSKYPEIMVD